MKFAEHLSAHITPEWRKQYISYEEMKAMLYLSVEEAPSAESVEPEELTRHFSNFDEVFILYCDKELKKINTFFSEKLAEATRKFANLRSDLASSLGTRKMKRSASIVERTKPDVPARKMQELKLAFSEFYLSLILLQNYQNLNYMGFKKILKKHDKLLTVNSGSRWMEENVDIAHFHVNKDIGRIIQETESTVILELEGGDRQKAMKRLRVPPLGEQQSPWTTFKVGLFSGSFIILLIAAVLSAFFHDGGVRNMRTGFRLYRGPLLIIAFLFCISVNIYGWRSSGVNHVLIFELDPRNHISEQDLMELSAVMGVIWAISFLSFLFSNDLSMSPYVNPCGLTVVMFFFLFNFSNTFNHDGRMWVIRILGKMVIAPLKHVGFADFWLADQLNSLTPVFTDLHFSVWFYATRNELLSVSDDQDFVPTYWFIVSKAAVSCIPAWIRFAQCLRRYYDSKEAFPHLVNAGKYSTTFFVIIFFTLRIRYASDYFNIYDNPFLWGWVISSIVSSVYAYIWDIRMDWGLLDKKAGENTFLREEIVYSSKSYYYFAMINDLILRFMWAIAFALTHNHFVDSELMSSLQASLELFRRFVWNYFRLENEHLNNCGQFRAVRDISIAPIDSSDYTQMIRMMDEDNGVINRNVKRKGVKKHPKEERRLLIPKESTLPELQFIA